MTGPGSSDGRRPPGAGLFRPGDWVRHPEQPEWGRGQVQSVVGPRVTVTFEHAGKVLVNVLNAPLEPDEG